jgi:hypothetical protein
MSNDFSSSSVSDLRRMLIESGKFTKEQAEAIKGKTKLVEEVLKLNGTEEDELPIDSMTSLLAQIEKEAAPAIGLSKDDEVTDRPSYNSPAWADYVMTQFAEDELQDGKYPNIVGLRRVAEELLGDIIQSGPTAMFAPTNTDGTPGRATCVYTVVFDWNRSGQERAFSAVGGAYVGNLDRTYQIYPEAMSEVRAEARALRKALKLKVAAIEEVHKDTGPVSTTNGEWNENDKLSATQAMFIQQKCKELKIDLSKFLKHGDYNFDSLDVVPKGVAVNMLEKINSYSTNTKKSLAIPQEISSQVN